ncbi:uncharacterized protein ALTATR162_LOCUS4475 [Alternaria atra]|uniref:UBA domain-containing protein n=1 Tax=Alternaria atra TaxID=119953 RepID=A0A8J2I1E2_9PLEO|nr:uncharacterized protein ALTATR162_LOCUS4475 [Alternaria atra]CAG5156678.1 unnamed protein product [Alternaria atra]
MARIVQDSDEELDDDLESDLPPPKQPDASAQPPSNETHGTGSTGRVDIMEPHSEPKVLTCSSESLKRAIEKAHRNHLQSQPSQDEPQSSVSLPEYPSKKRKTAVDPSPLKPSDDASAKKRGPITYGKAPKSIFGSSPTFKAPPEDPSGTNLAPPYEIDWLPEGTMRDNYAHHEPAMFPEPSSTVPNATMTQQHVLEVVNAPMMMGQEVESEGPRYFPPPEPSIPWSDLMKFTPAEAADQTESSDRDAPPTDVPSTTPTRTTQGGYEYSASQRSRCESSVPPKDSPLRNGLPRPEANEMGRKAASGEAYPTTTLVLPSTASPGTQEGGYGEAQKTRCRSKSRPVPIGGSDDDLAVLELPKEQYKPRPSRSRSLKVEEEQPIDYSVRPEKAKKVSRRRQTTAAVDANKITTPEKVRQICDMGFTPSTTSGALERHNGDVIHAIDWLVTNNVGHDELAPPSPAKVKPAMNKSNDSPAMDSETMQDIMRNLNEYRRDDTQVSEQEVVHVAVANDTTMQSDAVEDITKPLATELRSPTKVQVVISKKSPVAVSKQTPSSVAASNKKAKRRKTTLDQPESEPIEADDAVSEAVPAKKKARGRPKKTAPAVPPKDPNPELLEQTAEVKQHEEVAQIVEPESIPEKAKQDSKLAPVETKQAQSSDITVSTTASHSNPPSKSSPATTSETPEPKTKPITASPLNTGKVPYRVGLSKRARIAPLLRIVKK